MAYAIMRTKKLKTYGAIVGSKEHTMREIETPNADPEQTPNNQIIIEIEPLDDMRIKIESARTRPDNVLCLELNLTTSPEFWENKRPCEIDKAKINKWVKQNMEWLEKTFTKENLVGAVLHMDEKTPHIVAYVIPRDPRNRLNCKHYTGGTTKMRNLQSKYADDMKDFGLERGQEGSKATHQPPQKYYHKMDKIERQVIKDNPEVKLIAPPLPEPTVSDRLNITEYRDKIAKQVLAAVQLNVDQLIDQNKDLTNKLLIAEDKVATQEKELSRHRAILTRGRENYTTDYGKILEHDKLQEVFKRRPDILTAVESTKTQMHLEKNPHIAKYHGYRQSGLSVEESAYNLMRTDKCKKHEVSSAMEYIDNVSLTYKIIDATQDRINTEDTAAAEKAAAEKAAAEQARAAAQAAQEKIAILNYLNDEKPHIKKYFLYRNQGLTDQQTATLLIQRDNIKPKTVISTLMKHSPNRPKDSVKARFYATNIVNKIETPEQIQKASTAKTTGGGMVMGGGGGSNRDIQRQRTADRESPGIAALNVKFDDIDHRLEDTGMLTDEQIQTIRAEIRAKGED